MNPQIVPEHGLIDAWIRTDSLGPDLFSRKRKVHVEDYNRGLIGDFESKNIKPGAYWSNSAVGQSGSPERSILSHCLRVCVCYLASICELPITKPNRAASNCRCDFDALECRHKRRETLYALSQKFPLLICKAMKIVLPPAFPVVLALLFISGKLWSQSADTLIRVGDLFYAKLQAHEALKYYLPAEKLEPNNVRLLVHISREYRHLMSDATNTGEKVRLGGVAVDYANRAAALAPNDPEAQLAVAISYGKLQRFEGDRQRFEAVHIIKDAADKAIELDPHNDLAWHVLGRWYKGLVEVDSFHRMLAQAAFGGLPAATYEEAATCFEKAIQLNPSRLMHYIELGSVYAQLGRKDEARRLITKGLAMMNTEKDDPETKREGEQFLAELQ